MKPFRFLGIITALYITFQLASDLSAGKIIELFGYSVSATVLFFPITYVISDVLTEVYGYAEARRIVWMVLLSSVLAGVMYQLVVWLPPGQGFDANDAYSRVLGSVPRVLIGGWIAVWVGGVTNDYILAKMKVWTNGRHLWARTILSTIVGEFLNTALFYGIALSSVLPTSILVSAIVTGWLIKVAVEVLLTPWTYYVIGKLKQLEGVDHYDKNTDFNPFRLDTGTR